MRSSTLSIASLALIAQSLAAYVPTEAWTTLTPTVTLSGITTDYAQTFGIQIDPLVTTSSSASALAKRDVVTQIGDGQIQATTSTSSTSSKKTTAEVVTQIGDGQIQATTSTEAPKTTAEVVTQIGDGQIQATTSTEAPKTTAEVVTQIGDGQIQATTSTEAPKTTAEVVTQIGDGQIQATTSTGTTADVVTQIGDGQIQATTSTKTTADVITQIGDGQIQASTTASFTSVLSAPKETGETPESCLTDKSLAMTLNSSVLTDANGRIGSIVANRQFQFDGPPPQAGAIYAAGWGIYEGNLALGNTTVFYQCLSGSFYNLYDESIGSQCEPVYLKIVDLVDC